MCLNCDGMISTDHHYCPHCGQENVDINISLWEIFREASEEFIRLDSKLLTTLKPLVTKPGFLTKEWAKGRRARYLSPLKLYLTITAIYFLVVPYIHPHMGFDDAIASSAPVAAAPAKATASSRRANEGLTGTGLDKLTSVISGSAKQRNALIDQVVARMPTALFVVLPLFAGVLWLLYIRNNRFYVEHLVFALHCHAFYFLLLTAVALIPSHTAIGLMPQWLCLGVFPIYSLLALKGNYGQGWIKTFIKSIMLGYAYLMLGLTVLMVTMYAALTSLTDTATPVLETPTPSSSGTSAPIAAPPTAAPKQVR